MCVCVIGKNSRILAMHSRFTSLARRVYKIGSNHTILKNVNTDAISFPYVYTFNRVQCTVYQAIYKLHRKY